MRQHSPPRLTFFIRSPARRTSVINPSIVNYEKIEARSFLPGPAITKALPDYEIDDAAANPCLYASHCQHLFTGKDHPQNENGRY